MKGQTAIEYLMTYGWAILIILIVAGVLAYYGIFAPAGFLSPTARGFGQVQVLNPWSLNAADGGLTLNLENRVGGQISITDWTLDVGDGAISCDIAPDVDVNSGSKQVVSCTPAAGWTAQTAGSSYTATVTIIYTYETGNFTTTGTISGTYS
jgi:hypothetical protein